MFRDQKRGQITGFAIVAIVIIILSILVVMVKEKPEQATPVHIPIDAVENLVLECAHTITDEAIEKIAKQGGYVNLDQSPIAPLVFSFPEKEGFEKVAYGLIAKENVLLDRTALEYQVNVYVEESLSDCVNLERVQIPYEEDVIIVSSKVLDDEVVLEIQYPITFEKGSVKSKARDRYMLRITSMIGRLHTVAEQIVTQQQEESALDVIELLSLEFDIQFLPIDEFRTVFFIIDEEHNEVFQFAIENEQ